MPYYSKFSRKVVQYYNNKRKHLQYNSFAHPEIAAITDYERCHENDESLDFKTRNISEQDSVIKPQIAINRPFISLGIHKKQFSPFASLNSSEYSQSSNDQFISENCSQNTGITHILQLFNDQNQFDRIENLDELLTTVSQDLATNHLPQLAYSCQSHVSNIFGEINPYDNQYRYLEFSNNFIKTQ